MTSKKKIALVLGWGGVKCAASIGFLRVLSQEGIDIDMVVGSSAGSIFASFIASGYEADAITENIIELWSHDAMNKTNHLAILQILFPSIFKMQESYHVRDDKLINRSLSKAFGENRIEDTKIPLVLTATDFRTGEQVIFTEGKIAEAVRASIALPMIFKPVKKGDQLLVDSFLTGSHPIGVAIKNGADIILSMGFDTKTQAPFNSFSNFIMNLVGIMSNNLLHTSLSFYSLAHHDEVIPVMPELAEDIPLFDTERMPEIIAAGEKEAKKHINYIKRLVEIQR